MTSPPMRGVIAPARFLAGTLLAVATAMAAEPPDGDNGRRQIAEQKLRLVETLLESPRLKQAGADAEAGAALARVRQLLDAARRSIAARDHERAAQALDEALRAASNASAGLQRKAGGAGLTDRVQHEQNAELREQLEGYRASLAETAKQPGARAPAAAALEQVDQLTAAAQQQLRADRQGEANRLLAEAYQIAVSALARLNEGRTIVLALKFETPADEYAYEQQRHRSHALLVNKLKSEDRALGAAREAVDCHLDAGRRLRERAESEAAKQDFGSAVKTMENATAELVRALSAMGLNMF